MLSTNPAFALGSTAYEGDSTLITAAGLDHLKGVEWWFRDNDEDGTGVISQRSGRWRLFRVIKNDHSGAILPKLIVTLDTKGTEANGLGAEAAMGKDCAAVDEHLPAAGCAVGDLCWGCIRGIATLVGLGNSVNILDGDVVVMSSAGKVRKQDHAELDGDLYAEINSAVGRSIQGATVSTDDADILVNLFHLG